MIRTTNVSPAPGLNFRRTAAFVIACFSDPGLHSAREATNRPVLGIMESGILTALTLGQRFGVIAILRQSIPRHLRYVGALGVSERLAGELPVGLRVVELSDEKRTYSRMLASLIWSLPGVRDTRSYTVMEEVKNTTMLPI